MNHAHSSGVWLRLAKKESGVTSVSYREAVEAALCYGWIDGQGKRHDDASWLVKLTPRGPRSIWSKINREAAVRLTKIGKMKAAGLQEVNRAKADGRWDRAYDSPSRAKVPADFRARLNRNPKAKAFFATLNSANRYAVLWRIQTAKKAETRIRRMEKFITMLERKQKLHP
jgi:uncharacterized protein YdeI (YjbR/CyaY-like superfamily)